MKAGNSEFSSHIDITYYLLYTLIQRCLQSGKEIKDMTKKKKFKKVLIIVVVLSPLWLWLWFHPIQKSLAGMRFESYIAEQNVPEDDIKTKEVMRDAKRDVYEITVTYKTDPIIGDSEIVRIDNTIRINDEAIVFVFGNVDTDIEHGKPPLVIWK